MMINVRRWTGSLLVTATLALGTATPALAEHEPPRLGLTPIGHDGQFFDLTLRPGDVAELQVEVANFGHDEVQSRTYAADAYSIINGGFGAELFGEPLSGTSLWLDYPDREIALGPLDALVIEFSLTVPAVTVPGEYIVAVVAENVDPYRGDAGSVTLDQVNRAAIAVAIDVVGPRAPALEIGAVAHKAAAETSFVTFEIVNPGNAHLKPMGVFTLRDGANAVLATGPAVMDSVYAGSETLFETPLAAVLTPGDYCAELTLTDEKTGATDATECLRFTVEPPPAVTGGEGGGEGAQTLPILSPAIDAAIGNPLVAGLIATVALAVLWVMLLLWWRRRGRRNRGAAWLQARIGPEEPPWPAADASHATPRAPSGADTAAVLRTLLTELPEISRAWLIGESTQQVLVVEVAREIDPATGSGLARLLQVAMDARGVELRMRTRFVQGAGPVARVTAGAWPFYVRSNVPSTAVGAPSQIGG